METRVLKKHYKDLKKESEDLEDPIIDFTDAIAKANEEMEDLATTTARTTRAMTFGVALMSWREFAGQLEGVDDKTKAFYGTMQALKTLGEDTISALTAGGMTMSEIIAGLYAQQMKLLQPLKEELQTRQDIFSLIERGKAKEYPGFDPGKIAAALGQGMMWTSEQESEWYKQYLKQVGEIRPALGEKYAARGMLEQRNEITANITVNNPAAGIDVSREVEDGLINALRQVE